MADYELKPGQMVGEYRVERLIGQGGFGKVYAAIHPVIGKAAAIKVLNPELASNQEMVGRFVAEARAVNQIRHRNIIDIFAFGALPGGLNYFVMELLEGVTLDAYVKKSAPLDPGHALSLLWPVGRALVAAHKAGILHRDLKPENVFLTFDQDGDVFPKLLDFGIAKLLRDSELANRTKTGALMGTPVYMSPEQCKGSGVDHRTDIYSFGIMVHEVLTGRRPFIAPSLAELLIKQIHDPPPAMSTMRPDLPRALDAPVLRMLQKAADRRPATMQDALDELLAAARSVGYDIPSTARPSLTGPQPSRAAPAQAPPAASVGGASQAGAMDTGAWIEKQSGPVTGAPAPAAADPAQSTGEWLEQQGKSVTEPSRSMGAVPAPSMGAVPAPSMGAVPAQSMGAVPSQSMGAVPAQSMGAVPAQSMGAMPSLSMGAVPARSMSSVPDLSIAAGPPPSGAPQQRGPTPSYPGEPSPSYPAAPPGVMWGASSPPGGAFGAAMSPPGVHGYPPSRAAPAIPSGDMPQQMPPTPWYKTTPVVLVALLVGGLAVIGGGLFGVVMLLSMGEPRPGDVGIGVGVPPPGKPMDHESTSDLKLKLTAPGQAAPKRSMEIRQHKRYRVTIKEMGQAAADRVEVAYQENTLTSSEGGLTEETTNSPTANKTYLVTSQGGSAVVSAGWGGAITEEERREVLEDGAEWVYPRSNGFGRIQVGDSQTLKSDEAVKTLGLASMDPAVKVRADNAVFKLVADNDPKREATFEVALLYVHEDPAEGERIECTMNGRVILDKDTGRLLSGTLSCPVSGVYTDGGVRYGLSGTMSVEMR